VGQPEIDATVALIRALRAEGVTAFEGHGVKFAVDPRAVTIPDHPVTETARVSKPDVRQPAETSREAREDWLDAKVAQGFRLHNPGSLGGGRS